MGTLIDCPACGAGVSSEAASCPHCGQPFPQPRTPLAALRSAILGLAVVIALAVLVFLLLAGR